MPCEVTRLASAVIAALLLAGCKPDAPAPAGNGQATPAPVAPTPAPSPAVIALDPLSEADQLTLGTGCSCSFVHGDDTLIEVANNKAMLRIGGTLETCAITEAQATALSGGTGSFECEGYTIAMQGKGEVEQGQNDDQGRDATLTISLGGQSRVYQGAMACAC